MKIWQLKLFARGPFVIILFGIGGFLWWATYRWWVGVGYILTVGAVLGLISLSVWAGVKLDLTNKK